MPFLLAIYTHVIVFFLKVFGEAWDSVRYALVCELLFGEALASQFEEFFFGGLPLVVCRLVLQVPLVVVSLFAGANGRRGLCRFLAFLFLWLLN